MELKREIKTLIKEYSNGIKAEPDKSEYYFRRGNLFFQLNKYDKSGEDFINAIKFTINFPEALNNLGCVYHLQNNLLLAEKYFSEALQFKPDYEIAIKNRGLTYYKLQKYDKALKDLSELDPIEELKKKIPGLVVLTGYDDRAVKVEKLKDDLEINLFKYLKIDYTKILQEVKENAGIS